MEINKIYNENCFDTIEKMQGSNHKIDVIITSPPYNMTSRKGGYGDKCKRYDLYNDWMKPQEYVNFMVELFNNCDKILIENGVFLLNISYSIENPSMPYIIISEIIKNTPFTVSDTIVWKKRNGVPFPANKNRLSRIWEFVIVFVRKNEIHTYNTYKGIKSVSHKTGQIYYNLFYNYIEAKNNDGVNDLNKATYSSELIERLLDIYGNKGCIVYDPFMGTGTTGVACKRKGINYIGSEISNAQCDYSYKRLMKVELKSNV